MSADEKKLQMTVAVTTEGTLYVARCLEVEVTSQGESMDEALANLREALELYYEDQAEVVVPARPVIAHLDIEVRP